MIRDILTGMLNRLIAMALGGAIGWLVNHGIATKGETELLVLVCAAILASLVQSVASRLIKRWHIERALGLPEGSSIETLLRQSKATPLAVKLEEAISGNPQPAPKPEAKEPSNEI